MICGIVIKEKDLPKLKNTGAKDSKLLTPKQREKICKEIEKVIDNSKIIIVPPNEIDSAVLSNDGMNLNWLEAHKTAEILNELKPDVAYIDCPSPNIEKYTGYLQKLLRHKIKLLVSHKAERFYPVGAASILAKCRRDAEIVKIQKMMPELIGSGYPSDPTTKKFIAKYYKVYPEIMRKSWSTYQNLIKKGEQQGLDRFSSHEKSK